MVAAAASERAAAGERQFHFIRAAKPEQAAWKSDAQGVAVIRPAEAGTPPIWRSNRPHRLADVRRHRTFSPIRATAGSGNTDLTVPPGMLVPKILKSLASLIRN